MRTLVPVALVCLLLAAAFPMPAAATGCSNPGLSHDCLAAPREWLANPVTWSNAGATTEPGEPTACDGETVHASVWLTLEVLAPGGADAFKVNFDAPFWATLGAYTMSSAGTLSPVACHASWEDEGRHHPALFLPCVAGRVYHIQVGGQSPSDVGSFDLSESRWRKFDLSLSEPCPFKASPPGLTYLSPPTAGDGEIRVSWSEPYWTGGRGVSITHYNLYSAPTCSGAFELLATTTGRSHTHTGLGANATRCYRAAAVNVAGEGAHSSARSATTWDVPRAPRSLAIAPAGAGELRLTWLASPDAGGPAPILRQHVYRAPAAEGPFTLLATPAGDATSYVDAGLGSGATWHYRVSAENVVGEGAPGASAHATTWDVPDAPSDVRIRHRLTPGPIAFEVSWTAPTTSAPFTHYRVYRATESGGPATFIGDVPSTQTTYVDGGRGVLVDYHYEVRAWNPAHESAPSARACSVYPMETPLFRCR